MPRVTAGCAAAAPAMKPMGRGSANSANAAGTRSSPVMISAAAKSNPKRASRAALIWASRLPLLERTARRFSLARRPATAAGAVRITVSPRLSTPQASSATTSNSSAMAATSATRRGLTCGGFAGSSVSARR